MLVEDGVITCGGMWWVSGDRSLFKVGHGRPSAPLQTWNNVVSTMQRQLSVVGYFTGSSSFMYDGMAMKFHTGLNVPRNTRPVAACAGFSVSLGAAVRPLKQMLVGAFSLGRYMRASQTASLVLPSQSNAQP
jgi:hypothetical protein